MRLGLSQVQLAARTGCSLTTVSVAERTGFLSDSMALRFATALNLPLGVLKPGSAPAGHLTGLNGGEA